MVTERGPDTPRSADYATIHRSFRGDISEELAMTKSILVSLAILTLSLLLPLWPRIGLIIATRFIAQR